MLSVRETQRGCRIRLGWARGNDSHGFRHNRTSPCLLGLFAEELPALNARMERGNESSRWLEVGPRPLIAVHYIAGGGVGLFVRGARGTRSGLVREHLFPHREFLSAALDRPVTRLPENFLLGHSLRGDMMDRTNWPSAIAWFAEQSPIYESALAALQKRQADFC